MATGATRTPRTRRTPFRRAPPTVAAAPVPAPLFTEPVDVAGLDPAAPTFAGDMAAWLAGHGVLFDAGPAVLTGLAAPAAGGPGELTADWSVSDGRTVVRVGRV